MMLCIILLVPPIKVEKILDKRGCFLIIHGMPPSHHRVWRGGCYVMME